MASASGDRTLSLQGTRRPELEQFPCPRCESTNTKFCYYNNYNLSQPRHFCKSCRRYWTRGGSLRNVPVGGGTRKVHPSNKRPRINPSKPTISVSTSTAGLVSCNTEKDEMLQTETQTFKWLMTNPGPGKENLNEAAERPDSCNSSSWLGGQMGASDELSPINNYGVGISAGLGYGLNMLEWPMENMSGGIGGSVPDSPGGNAWQMAGDGDDSGAADGDYFSWPENAVPTPAKALK